MRLLALLTLLPSLAAADGFPIRDGRYQGRVAILELTDAQVRALDAARTWKKAPREPVPAVTLDGLELTPSQRDALVRHRRGVPRRLLVYETRDGENDCLCFGACNVAFRFERDRIQVALEYLAAEGACRVEEP